MDNQHKKITGYRDLTQAEIDLMNEIKAQGLKLQELCAKVDAHSAAQMSTALGGLHSDMRDEAEVARIQTAQPSRWISIARTDFQTGLMALTRAVAQPTTF